MTNLITQILLDHLPAHKRKAPNGWLSFNSVCCEHRGHTVDTRRRGGVLLTRDGVVYSCFNCQFTTGYKVGQYLGIKFRKLLRWAGVDAGTIDALRIQAIRDRDNLSEEDELTEEIVPVSKSLPDRSELLEPKHTKHWRYLENRGIDPNCYPFYVTALKEHNLNQRIIVPYTYQNLLVGYTARSIAHHKPKYMQS